MTRITVADLHRHMGRKTWLPRWVRAPDRKETAFPARWMFIHREAPEMSSGENAQDRLVRIPRIAVRLEQEP